MTTSVPYYEKLHSEYRAGYVIIVDKTNDYDMSVFDERPHMNKIRDDIMNGKLEYFCLRVRVLVEGFELSSEHLGGCVYADPKTILTNGTSERLIADAMNEAKSRVYHLYKTFEDLSWELDAEGVERVR